VKLEKYLLLVLVAFLALMIGCKNAPGKGKVAELGRARGAKLILSIESFDWDRAQYPQTLDELVPSHLSTSELKELLSEPPRFEYISGPRGYNLAFEYTGPGMNYCSHTSESIEPMWACGGFY